MIKINSKLRFTYQERPKIISEISGNHNGSISLLKKHISAAKKNGADLVKIQTYEPEDITFKKVSNYFKIKGGIWKNLDLWKLYEKACTPIKWHKDVFSYARDNDICLFSTPFSLRAVDVLENLKVKLFKIASMEITDLKLIDRVAQTKKPVIISTGLANNNEIYQAIKTVEKYHKKIILLHCVSKYPTKIEDANISRITELKNKYKKYMIGLSDHTKDIVSSLSASAKNIVAIEKHFKLNHIKSVDSLFSINEKKLQELRHLSEKIFLSLKPKNNINKDEVQNKFLRRSIYAKKDIKKGQIINTNNIQCLRPKLGICASNYFKIIGLKTNKDIKKDSPIKKKDFTSKV